MGKRVNAGMAKRIKTRHKKTNKARKITDESNVVNPAIKDINKVITSQTKTKPIRQKADHDAVPEPVEQLQAMTIESFRKLTGATEKK